MFGFQRKLSSWMRVVNWAIVPPNLDTTMVQPEYILKILFIEISINFNKMKFIF